MSSKPNPWGGGVVTRDEADALKRFAGKLIMGDVAGAAAVLTEEEPPPTERAPTKEDDPPCDRIDGELVCKGHGFDGACVFGPREVKAK